MAIIKIKSGTGGAPPADSLAIGELALDRDNKRLFTSTDGSAITWIGAQIESSPSDWTSSTKLATQSAIDARLKPLGSSTTPTTGNIKTGSNVWTSGLYNYHVYSTSNSEPDAPTRGGSGASQEVYGAVIGFGKGSYGSAELFSTWVANSTPALFLRTLADNGGTWGSWNQVLTLSDTTLSPTFASVKIKESGGSDTITLAAPSISSSYTLTLPTTAGSANQVLQTNGSGDLTWATVGTEIPTQIAISNSTDGNLYYLALTEQDTDGNGTLLIDNKDVLVYDSGEKILSVTGMRLKQQATSANYGNASGFWGSADASYGQSTVEIRSGVLDQGYYRTSFTMWVQNPDPGNDIDPFLTVYTGWKLSNDDDTLFYDGVLNLGCPTVHTTNIGTAGIMDVGDDDCTSYVRIATGTPTKQIRATGRKIIQIGMGNTDPSIDTEVDIGNNTYGSNLIRLYGETTINGSLTVNGTVTTINSNVVTVDDKRIELGSVASIAGVTATLSTGTAVVTVSSTTGMIIGQTLTKTGGTGEFGLAATISSVDSATQFTASVSHLTSGAITFTVGGATDLTAFGGGITLKGDTDKTITWSSDTWNSSENFGLSNGKVYKISGIQVLSSSAVLGLSVSSGTISSGTWNGTAIGTIYGGTGLTSYATGDIIYASDTNTLSKLTKPSSTGDYSAYLLSMTSAGTAAWKTPSELLVLGTLSAGTEDWNTYKTTGRYKVALGGNSPWTNTSNTPGLAYSYGELQVSSMSISGSDVITQIYYPHRIQDGIWIRSSFYNTTGLDYGDWERILTTNITNVYAVSGIDDADKIWIYDNSQSGTSANKWKTTTIADIFGSTSTTTINGGSYQGS